jgi:peptide/nickel transport system permease protein
MSAVPVELQTRFRWRGRRRRVAWNKLDRVCLGFICLVALVAIFAPLIEPQSPNAVDILHVNAGPSGAHLLGTDDLGRDLLSRLIAGSRTSLLGPALVSMLSMIVGLAIGMFGAWRGGWVDNLISSIVNAMFAFPGLLLAILAVAVFGPGLSAPVIALSISYVPYVARVTRASTLRERNLPYVEALEAVGFRPIPICVRHIIPNISGLVIAQVTLGFGYAMVDLAAISFLGLGVQPPTSDWGLMVASGQPSILGGYPEQSLYAGLMIVLTVLAVTIVGERVAANAEARR